jgi:hypothetical protein
LGAVAILLAALTSSLHADAADGVCDILKDKQYTKGLYGICVAYWSGDADKSKFEEKYYARIGILMRISVLAGMPRNWRTSPLAPNLMLVEPTNSTRTIPQRDMNLPRLRWVIYW